VSDLASDAILFACVLVLTLALGAPLIRGLRRLAYHQVAYEDAPKTHAVKSGTPTMGGILFLVALLATLVVRHDRATVSVALLGLLCGAVGFVDDYLAVRGGSNRGLRARTKLLLTGVAAAVFLALLARDPLFAREGTLLTLGLDPAHFVFIAPDWVWLILCLCAVVATTHAVNLTDGLDGLAAGAVLPPLAVVAWLAARAGAPGVTALDIATGAGCLGFLAYNRHPARLFMGDTGSLALGGVIAGSAIVAGNVLLLPLIGGVFAAETISVILQVAYFKATHKRIFRMSPLHHHFELGGWPETKVTSRFWTASALLSIAGVAIAR
jgi:phospho-N-acetylmuramoyl-pentapeptide-transferase